MAAAAVVSPSEHRSDDIFLSVFPKPNFTTPTPEATPQIGTISSPVESSPNFGSFHNVSSDAIEFSRAWSTATRFLTLSSHNQTASPPVDSNVLRAFAILLQASGTQKHLVSWYSNEIGVHFRSYVRPLLQAWDSPISLSDAVSILQSSAQTLQTAQQHYLSRIYNLSGYALQQPLRDQFHAFRARIINKLHSTVLHSLPKQRLQKTLTSAIHQHLVSSLQHSSNTQRCRNSAICHCKVSLQGLSLKQWSEVGLGGLLAERAIAHAVHKFLQGPAIERRCFQVVWTQHVSVVPKLRVWVEQNLAPEIEQALAALTQTPDFKLASSDMHRFIAVAVSGLGRLRAAALFDYIKRWPDSTAAILDVREYIGAGDQADKAHVCQAFSNQIQSRLLHAGASTSEILSIYVNVIHAFKTLDSRGVLLEKVALPLQSYLRSREDAVGIIAASFLADVDEDKNGSTADIGKICSDITREVANSTLEEKKDGKVLTWNDMNWMPDPIDAGPDYKSSKSEDVIANILSLFEQEEFIKEVTTVLAQHLLHGKDPEYTKETRLVELFKSRLDPSKLQAAEVMLKDVRDSVSLGKRINPRAVYDMFAQPPPTPREIQAAIPAEGISLSALYQGFEARMHRAQFVAAVKLVATKRNDLFYAKRTRLPPDAATSTSKAKEEGETTFKAQILSSFFWPQLRSNSFSMPDSLEEHRIEFEKRFHALGSQRKLHFQPALARVSLKLELEDRIVEESDVPAWRASVIDGFSKAGDGSVTVEQLMQQYDMEEELVQDALNFWTSKKVLYQPASGLYAILERLDMDVGFNHDAAGDVPMQDAPISAVVSQDAMLRENAAMFEIFIANMLRNQGAKSIAGMMGITNLLKMVLPTFTFGDEEVVWLLAEMEKRGEVVRDGELWRIAS